MYNLPIEIQDYILDFIYENHKLSYIIHIIESLQRKHEEIFFKRVKLDHIWNDPYIEYNTNHIYKDFYNGKYNLYISFILTRFLSDVENELKKYIKLYNLHSSKLYFYKEYYPIREEYCSIVDNIIAKDI
jgi:hypothetical protein